MKKTILLAGALIAIIAFASVFYNNYQKNDPSQLGPSGIYSEVQGQESSSPSGEGSSTTNSEDENSDILPAVDFTVYTQDGEVVNLSDFYGKPIVVNFWATWCGPCKSELPAFEKLSTEYKDDVVFMMVNLTDGAQETVGSVSEFIMDNGYHFTVYFDTDMDAALTYGVYSIPATLFIDADGNIVASHMGAMSESTLRNYIENLLIPAE